MLSRLPRLPRLARTLVPMTSPCSTSRPMSSIVDGIFTGKTRAPLPALPTVNLFQFMRETGKWGEVADKVALRCSTEDFRPITYKELEGRVSATTHALRGIGFQKGDVLNVHLHNCQQYVVTFLACAQLGGIASTSNPAYVAAELANQHVDSGSKFVLSSKAYEAVVTAAAAESGLSDKVFYVEDPDCFANAKATDEPPPEPDMPIDVMKDLLTLPYSSGTTGKPKGVMLTHHNMSTNLLQCMEASSVTRDDTLIGVLPLYHIYGMLVLMCYALVQQSELVLLTKFDPVPFLDAMSKFKVSVGFFVPPIILFLAKHPVVQQYDLSTLKWIMSGAAPLDPVTQKALSSELGVPISQGWGMTELSPIGCLDDHFNPVWGSSGTLASGTEGLIIDEEGKPLPAGEVGELLIRGPQVMQGYLGRPDATAETIRPDGFLRSGDIAYRDAENRLFFVDRLKELIKVKGFQVAPAEVEGALLKIDQVADAAVIGVPDERSGQVPKAFVVLQPNAALSADEVRAALGETLAAYKLPAVVEFVEAIPKSPSGKILRKDIRAAEGV